MLNFRLWSVFRKPWNVRKQNKVKKLYLEIFCKLISGYSMLLPKIMTFGSRIFAVKIFKILLCFQMVAGCLEHFQHSGIQQNS